MGTVTKIEWCHHTFNPWRGCERVSPGCDNCYAERMGKRNPKVLGEWGPFGVRAMAAEPYWRKPLAWNREAEKAGERRRVFCGSLMDFFEDREELETCRDRLLAMALITPWLDWLLLTKRPDDARAYFHRLNERRRGFWHGRVGYLWDQGAAWNPKAWSDAAWEAFVHRHGHTEEPKCLGDSAVCVWPLPNVWVGVTAEDQDRADERIPVLLSLPAAVRFVSYEPALGPLDLSGCMEPRSYGWVENHCTGPEGGSAIDWLIAGGESGSGARPAQPAWFRSVRDQCQAAGVSFFFKQWGEWLPSSGLARPNATLPCPVPDRNIREIGGEYYYRTGKKHAGRLLDGRVWGQVPNPSRE